MTIVEVLIDRAERGQERGAEAIWDEARKAVPVVVVTKNRRPLWLVAAAVALPFALVAGTVVWLNSTEKTASTVVVGDVSYEPADFTDAQWNVLPDPQGTFKDAGLRIEATEFERENFPPSAIERIEIDSTLHVNALTNTSTGFVAVGSEMRHGASVAAVWESLDGVNWRRTPDNAAFGSFDNGGRPKTPAGWSLEHVAEHDGIIVALGSSFAGQGDPLVWVNDHNEGWQRIDNALNGWTGDEALIHQLLATPNGFLVIGNDSDGSFDPAKSVHVPIMWRSTDGLTWTLVDLSALGVGNIITGAVAVGSQIVLVGTTGTVTGDAAAWVSEDDGTTWEQATVPTAIGSLPNSSIQRVAHGPDGFLALGQYETDEGFGGGFGPDGVEITGDIDLALWSSPDGRIWTEISVPDINEITDGEIADHLTYGPGGFVFSVQKIIRNEAPNEDQSDFWQIDILTYLLDDSGSVTPIDQPELESMADLIGTPTGYSAAVGDGPSSAIWTLQPPDLTE